MNKQNEIIDDEKGIPRQPIKHGTNRILNDSSIYFKGLIGMILCIVPAAIIGLVLIKISLEQSKEALKMYQSNPGLYSIDSIQLVIKGRRFAFVGLGLFIIELLALVAIMTING